MIQRLQALPPQQRLFAYLGILVSIALVFIMAALFILIAIIRNSPRTVPLAVAEGITVREFAQLPGKAAYPAALALAPDGTLYTGSYLDGTVWALSPEAEVTELPLTQAQIGSVTALEVGADGTLYVLDRLDPLQQRGMVLWRLGKDGTLEALISIGAQDSDTVALPDDLAIDDAGYFYVSDRGTDTVWRFNPDGTARQPWWRSPQADASTKYAPTGLAYDPVTQSLLIGDSFQDVIHRVALDDPSQMSVVYDRAAALPDAQRAAGFDGLALGSEGQVYIAALGFNEALEYNPNTGQIRTLAAAYRGSSDVAYDAARRRLYVANWDQRSLLPVPVLFFNISVDPHTPFSVDVIEFP